MAGQIVLWGKEEEEEEVILLADLLPWQETDKWREQPPVKEVY